MSTWAILTDTTRCTGCEECVKACKLVNHLGKDVPRRWKQRIDDLSSTRYTTILRCPGGHSIRQQCRHCLDPACVSACLVGALQKTPEGPVIYDREKCMGCRYCMMACPYGIPRYDWDQPVPYIRKCNMCYERLQEGHQPACVDACEQEATIFGSLGDMREEARRRIREAPDRYIDKVFGETEVGGTSVIYISDISLDFAPFKPLLEGKKFDDESLPELTWAALSKVPLLAAGVGGVMTGVWWIIGRRMKFAQEMRQSPRPDEEIQGQASGPARSPSEDEEKQGS